MKVLVCDSISPRAVERMRKAGLEVDVDDKITPGGAAREDRRRTTRWSCAAGPRCASRSSTARRNLKVVVRGGVGVDNIDVDYAEAKGIRIMNTPGASTHSVAELTIAYMFALARPIVQATDVDARRACGRSRSSRASRWRARCSASSAWAASARRWRSARPRSACWCSAMTAAPSAPRRIMHMVELDELLAKADFISLHIPLTESSKHMHQRRDVRAR